MTKTITKVNDRNLFYTPIYSSWKLKGNFHGNLVIRGNNIEIDGNGFTVYGYICVENSHNITVKNINVVIDIPKHCYWCSDTKINTLINVSNSTNILFSDINLNPNFPLDFVMH
jgi:hypothetical protein